MKTTTINSLSSRFKTCAAEQLAHPGEVTFANVSTTAQATEWMPEAVIGLVKQNGLVECRKFIAPEWRSVYSNTEASYPYFEREESFKSANYDEIKRALGGEFPYLSQHGTRKSVVLENIGLSVALEKSLALTDNAYKERNAQMLVNALESATLVEAFGILEDAAGEPQEWRLSGDKNPDAFVKTLIRESGAKAGARPNRFFYGEAAWDMRDEWLDKQNTAGGFGGARDEASLSTRLKGDVYVPDARIKSGANLFPTIGSDKIFGFIGFNGTVSGDVSNVKTIIGKNGGLKVTEWDHPQGELLIITVSRWQAVVKTSDLGAFAVNCVE